MEENEKISSAEYKQIVQLIKETEKDFKDIKDTVLNLVTGTYNLKEDIIDAVMGINYVAEDTAPDSVTMNQIKSVIDQFSITKEERSLENYLDAFRAAKNASNVIKSSEKELLGMKKDASDMVSGYIAYMASPEAEKSRKEKLEAMESAYELETDEYCKKKMKEKIDQLRDTMDFSFIFERINKYGKEEIDNIVKTFFNRGRGAYIIDKYINKIHLFKFDNGIYKMFFNIEENFLDEKYHDFNNLFLFIYMRYVSHCDPYKRNDFLRVHSITSALARLVYHKFKPQSDVEDIDESLVKSEPWFLDDVICKMLDYFEDYKDYFHEHNATRPGHEARIKAQAENELKRKSSLLSSIETLGLKEGEDYNKDMTAKELQKIYNDKVEEMIEAQKEDMDEKGENTTITEDEDGVVNIEPQIVTDVKEDEDKKEESNVISFEEKSNELIDSIK